VIPVGSSEAADEPDDEAEPLALPEAAAAVAASGIPVFPLFGITAGSVCACLKGADCQSPGKHPRTPNGFRDATTDLAVVREWWIKWPDSNIGVPTGTPSGLFAVDVDPRHGGDGSLQKWEQQRESALVTRTVGTGGGGVHHLFAYPTDGRRVRSRQGWLPGVDVRADGGYIVYPPSLHRSGLRYKFTQPVAALGAAPADLLTSVRGRRHRAQGGAGPTQPRPASEQPIAEGERNSTLTARAGHLFGQGLAASAVRDHVDAINQARCDPPLDDDEVERIVASVARYGNHYMVEGKSGDRIHLGRLAAVADSYPWSGKEGNAQRAVVAAFHHIAGRVGNLRFSTSDRAVSELTMLNRNTVNKACQQLVSRGWIEDIGRGMAGIGSRWRLVEEVGNGPLSVGRFQSRSDARDGAGRGGDPELAAMGNGPLLRITGATDNDDMQHRLPELNANDVAVGLDLRDVHGCPLCLNGPFALPNHDVFSRGALGLIGWRALNLLDVRGPHTAMDIAVVLGQTTCSIREALSRCAAAGLVACRHGQWTTISHDLDLAVEHFPAVNPGYSGLCR